MDPTTTATLEHLQDTMTQTLGRLMHLWMQASRRFFKERGLSTGQAMVLRHLYYRGPCTVSGMAAQMEISNPAASQFLDRLVEIGLVTREENPQDRRQKRITLTPRGRALVEEAQRVQQQWLQNLLSSLSPEEIVHLQRAFEILKERVDAINNLQQGGEG